MKRPADKKKKSPGERRAVTRRREVLVVFISNTPQLFLLTMEKLWYARSNDIHCSLHCPEAVAANQKKKVLGFQGSSKKQGPNKPVSPTTLMGTTPPEAVKRLRVQLFEIWPYRRGRHRPPIDRKHRVDNQKKRRCSGR